MEDVSAVNSEVKKFHEVGGLCSAQAYARGPGAVCELVKCRSCDCVIPICHTQLVGVCHTGLGVDCDLCDNAYDNFNLSSDPNPGWASEYDRDDDDGR